jgi:hypothetical protein
MHIALMKFTLAALYLGLFQDAHKGREGKGGKDLNLNLSFL